jgi:hypothetical protein
MENKRLKDFHVKCRNLPSNSLKDHDVSFLIFFARKQHETMHESVETEWKLLGYYFAFIPVVLTVFINFCLKFIESQEKDYCILFSFAILLIFCIFLITKVIVKKIEEEHKIYDIVQDSLKSILSII